MAKIRVKQSKFMQRCVADVAGQGKDTEAAFAICTAQQQKAGYAEPGSRALTGKGQAREKAFKGKRDMGAKRAAYLAATGRTEAVEPWLEKLNKEKFAEAHRGMMALVEPTKEAREVMDAARDLPNVQRKFDRVERDLEDAFASWPMHVKGDSDAKAWGAFWTRMADAAMGMQEFVAKLRADLKGKVRGGDDDQLQRMFKAATDIRLPAEFMQKACVRNAKDRAQERGEARSVRAILARMEEEYTPSDSGEHANMKPILRAAINAALGRFAAKRVREASLDVGAVPGGISAMWTGEIDPVGEVTFEVAAEQRKKFGPYAYRAMAGVAGKKAEKKFAPTVGPDTTIAKWLASQVRDVAQTMGETAEEAMGSNRGVSASVQVSAPYLTYKQEGDRVIYTIWGWVMPYFGEVPAKDAIYIHMRGRTPNGIDELMARQRTLYGTRSSLMSFQGKEEEYPYTKARYKGDTIEDIQRLGGETVRLSDGKPAPVAEQRAAACGLRGLLARQEEAVVPHMTWAGGKPSQSEDQFGWELVELLDVLKGQFSIARQLRMEIAMLGLPGDARKGKELSQKMTQLKDASAVIKGGLAEAVKIFSKWERA